MCATVVPHEPAPITATLIDMAGGYGESMVVAVVVPVKAFSQAKVRLTPRLDPATRAELARAMADRVLRAAGTLPTSVVCDDDEVAAWAQRHGAEVIWTPGLRSEEHTSELQSLMRISYAVFCLTKTKQK